MSNKLGKYWGLTSICCTVYSTVCCTMKLAQWQLALSMNVLLLGPDISDGKLFQIDTDLAWVQFPFWPVFLGQLSTTGWMQVSKH